MYLACRPYTELRECQTVSGVSERNCFARRRNHYGSMSTRERRRGWLSYHGCPQTVIDENDQARGGHQ